MIEVGMVAVKMGGDICLPLRYKCLSTDDIWLATKKEFRDWEERGKKDVANIHLA